MKISISNIQERVAVFFGISMIEILSDRKARGIVRPRQVAMYLAKEMTLHSFPAIGRAFHRDHTTIMAGVQRVSRLMDENRSFHDKVRDIRVSLEAPRDDL